MERQHLAGIMPAGSRRSFINKAAIVDQRFGKSPSPMYTADHPDWLSFVPNRPAR
jgi:hypothetical protein